MAAGLFPPTCSRLFICHTLTFPDSFQAPAGLLPEISGLESDLCPSTATVATAAAGLAAAEVKGGPGLSGKQLFRCYQPAVRRSSADSQLVFSPFPRPKRPMVVLALNL